LELRTAKKDYEDCIFHMADCEVLKQEQNSVIRKFVGIHKDKENDKEFLMHKMRSGVWFQFKYDHVEVLLGKRSPLKWKSKFFMKDDFISFTSKLPDVDIVHGQTQYNCIVDNDIVKIHGDPTINHHDWVVVKVDGSHVICHVLCFLQIENVKTNLSFATSTVDCDGLYAVCHFVNQNVFSDIKPTDDIYGQGDFVSY